MKTRTTILLILILGATLTYLLFWNMFEIYLFGGPNICGGIKYTYANSNDVATVKAEINSPELRSMVFRAAGVGAFGRWRLRNLQTTFWGDDLYSWGFSKVVNSKISDTVYAYLSCRIDGHSSAYCREVLRLLADPSTNRSSVVTPKGKSPIPDKWIREICTSTNKDGNTAKNILVIDGNIAWSYKELSLSDGRYYHHPGFKEKRDAIEFNPVYTNTIIEVEKQVEEKMKKEGSYGLFGSCHGFWRLKKDILKERGINWRSPPELNPDTCYD